MAALAECPNVMAKLGGLNMDINGFGWEERDLPPTSAELVEATRRYFDYTIETFGVERCMFESNFPVDKLSCDYTVLWNSFKLMTKGFSADERAALFQRYRRTGLSGLETIHPRAEAINGGWSGSSARFAAFFVRSWAYGTIVAGPDPPTPIRDNQTPM